VNKGLSFQVFNQAKFVVQIDQGKKDGLVDFLRLSFSAMVSNLPVKDLPTELAEL